MIPSLRKYYNENFTAEKYQTLLSRLDNLHPGAIEFRLAETPVFIPKNFGNQMLQACEAIIDMVVDPKFMTATVNSIPVADKVPGLYGYPHMIAFDFGVCHGEDGQLVPMLVEMQGFPSLYAFQAIYPDIMRTIFPVPDNFSQYLNNFDPHSYAEFFKKVVLGSHAPENVILLEIKPHEQKTKIDFYLTQDITGIQPVCITELIKEGRKVFYMRSGVKTPVKRIYNRVIFDELHATSDFKDAVDIRDDLDVEWVPHPDWFYRISKYTLPFISHPCVPETFFLNEIKQLPSDLHQYVLKPLFSFAGQGVVIDVKQEDIDGIMDPQNWILQRKVRYADVIETPAEPAKTEIRIMYLWEEGAARPVPVINLARLSKGKMIGTRYNKDKDWVGGTVAFIERLSPT
jgi:hypothetical protein